MIYEAIAAGRIRAIMEIVVMIPWIIIGTDKVVADRDSRKTPDIAYNGYGSGMFVNAPVICGILCKRAGIE